MSPSTASNGFSSSKTSFIDIPQNSDFTLANLPYGVFSTAGDGTRQIGVAIGDHILNLKKLSSSKVFSEAISNSNVDLSKIEASFQRETLNDFAALGKNARVAVREALLTMVSQGSKYEEQVKQALVSRRDAQMHLPFFIGDYTDFYASINHARNLGTLLRGADNALQPNYVHIPIGYHGRASTVVVSGTPIRRPIGQVKPPTHNTPNFMPTARLDIELEFAAFVSTPNETGERIDIENAEDHIFGYVLMNDWSARDIQGWEYVPLGPFTAKNFATSISPWVVTNEAMEPFRVPRTESGELLPYLREETRKGKEVFDINLQVDFKSCGMRTGDLLASGTISGTDATTVGSFMEASQNGKVDIEITSDIKRKFLEDGDELTITGYAGSGDSRVGFGECAGQILPAKWGKLERVEGTKRDTA